MGITSRAKSPLGDVGKHLGRLLRDLRKSKGLSVKEVWVKDASYSDESSIRRLERGRRPSREQLIGLLRNGYDINDLAEINRVLAEARYDVLSTKEELQYKLRQAVPQLVRWRGGQPQEPGLLVVSPDQQFIPWSQLKPEIERNLLRQEARVPLGSRVITKGLHERPNFVIRIVNAQGVEIGSVWLGGDPYKNWAHDGLVRLGISSHVSGKEPVVWRVMQRYSDGSYRPIEAR